MISFVGPVAVEDRASCCHRLLVFVLGSMLTLVNLGRNKLIINHLGRLFVTSDAATIIREIEVAHPAAKLLVMASTAQEAEMGDGTNLVLIFAGELLKRSEHLLTMGLHPSDVIQGYEMALAKGREELESE